MYERLLYDQLYPYFDEIFSKLQCGFCEGYNAEQSLISKIEKWRKALDIGDNAGALLFDLSKIFVRIDQELLIAKHNVYGLNSWYILISILENTEQKK